MPKVQDFLDRTELDGCDRQRGHLKKIYKVQPGGLPIICYKLFYDHKKSQQQ